MINSAIAICLILNKEHYYETGKDNIGVQCKHRLERDDRGDNSQTLHGKTPAGESSDKTISFSEQIFRITMKMHQRQLSAATHTMITMRSKY